VTRKLMVSLCCAPSLMCVEKDLTSSGKVDYNSLVTVQKMIFVISL
jgi:hypothetical protein